MHNVPHTAAARSRISASKRGRPVPAKRRPKMVVDGITLYRCGACLEFLPRERFHSERRTLFGIKSQCRRCHGRCSVASRNPENQRRLRRESEARRRARQRGAPGSVPSGEMAALSILWGSHCLKCGSTERLQWDHIVPLARRGSHCVSNLQRLCRACNEIKQAKVADYRSNSQKVWVLTFRRLS